MVYRDSVYQVPRQKVQVEVEKLDAEKETALAGAVFGLYTAETITDWRGRELLKAGTLLGTAETTENSEGQVQKSVFRDGFTAGKLLCGRVAGAEGVSEKRNQTLRGRCLAGRSAGGRAMGRNHPQSAGPGTD